MCRCIVWSNFDSLFVGGYCLVKLSLPVIGFGLCNV
jgi:hypothetical protein